MYQKMEPKAKAAWLAALRSGDYQQGSGRLREGSLYCCLGVLCNLGASAKEKWHAYDVVQNVFYYGLDGDLFGMEKALNYPPKDVAEKAGLSNEAANILGKMNDAGKSFGDIANWIEENL